MTLVRVLITATALWLAARVVGGISLADGLDPLAAIGTVLVVALVLSAIQLASRGLRRVVIALIGPGPLAVAVVVAVALNALVFWAGTALTAAIGLGYTVDGLRAVLVGSLLVLVAPLAMTDGRRSVAG